jgi:hypothetical protein
MSLHPTIKTENVTAIIWLLAVADAIFAHRTATEVAKCHLTLQHFSANYALDHFTDFRHTNLASLALHFSTPHLSAHTYKAP